MNRYVIRIYPAAPENDALNYNVGNVGQSQKFNDELGASWNAVGQSSNIEDRRDIQPPRGMRRVQIGGRLLIQNPFHFSNYVASNIAQSFLRRGVWVRQVSTAQFLNYRSVYSFYISLWVFNQNSPQAIRQIVGNALADIAYPSNIRIESIF